MKTQTIKSLLPVLLSVALTLTACGATDTPNTTTELQQSESRIASDAQKALNDATDETSESTNVAAKLQQSESRIVSDAQKALNDATDETSESTKVAAELQQSESRIVSDAQKALNDATDETSESTNVAAELQQSENDVVSDDPKMLAKSLSKTNDTDSEVAKVEQNESDTISDIPQTSVETQSGTDDVPAEFEEQFVVQSTPNDSDYDQLEYWSIDEFEVWMEQQYEENQRLADIHDKSFYDKDVNGDYYCREWTQEDVDALYTEWQKQLELMKQGYQFTKPIPYSNDGVISGVFGPEANDPPASAPGSTIIALPDGSTVDLGHFDTAGKAAQAVEQYLTQQVKAGMLTQDEADNIFEHGAIE